MQISKAYKFRLYPTKKEADRLQHYSNVCRLYYNLCLHQHNLAKEEDILPTLLEIFKKRQEIDYSKPKKCEEVDFEKKRKTKIFHTIFYHSKNEGVTSQSHQIKLFKEIDWISDVPYSCRQESVRSLNTAFKNFFRRVKKGQKILGSKKNPFGYPTFKKKGKHNSISFKPSEVKIISQSKAAGGDQYDGFLKIPKFETKVKIRQDREIPGKILGSTISKKNEKWYVSFTVQEEIPDPLSKNGSIGIDVGVKHFAALSDGSFIEHGHPWRKFDAKIKKFQRKAAKQVKFSGRWQDTMLKINRLKEKQMNQRSDFLHKTTHKLTNDFGIISIENLKTVNMVASAKGTVEKPGQNVKDKSHLNRVILEQSWGEFGRQLDYKSTWKGGTLNKKDPRYTSQMCSECGHIDRKNRVSQSKFVCQNCGLEENADLNASKNIEAAEPLTV